MKFDVLTLFPEMFEPLKMSIIGKAIEKKTYRHKFGKYKRFFKR